MQAARIHEFGGPEVIELEEVPVPRPGPEEVLVRVHAAGVGPWDAWIRGGKSVLPQPLPLTLGSDFSGVVIEVGPDVRGFEVGQPVFGVTNKQFTGAYAEYAAVRVAMIANKPASLDHRHCAGIPVVAVTALQMLVDVARVRAGQRVLVLGAGGNVGAYAIQLARLAGAYVIAADRGDGLDYARRLGPAELVDTATTSLERAMAGIDIVIDTVGGELAARAVSVLAPGGILVSSVVEPKHARTDVRAVFLLVDVTSKALETIADGLAGARLVARLGSVLPLADARDAHLMLAGAAPHLPGKIVLDVSTPTIKG
jgi:NADPH:quinone reductase-like Zn-dependent oxidoreductase